MTLPASGPLAMTDIQTEFGGTNPIGLNEYYAGGGLVPAGTSGTYGAVPSSGALSIQNFYGTSQFVPIYVEDVFSTYLYTGTNVTQAITNGIDLAGEGGLVWTKARNLGEQHQLIDSARGYRYTLASNSTNANFDFGANIITPSSTGFTLSSSSRVNQNAINYASWTFRKQPKFFDVVTYTGNRGAGSTSPQTLNHNLGSVPGCIIIKKLTDNSNWVTYHRSLPTPNDNAVFLNLTNAALGAGFWANTAPTSTTFTVGSDGDVNETGKTYVAYLFAHDAGGFGLTGTDNVVSCGSAVLDGSGNANVTLGYEPQWILAKQVSATSNWELTDTMRGMPVTGFTSFLKANTSGVEDITGATTFPTATGFKLSGASFSADATVIYIAIRRGPMKVPTLGTSVFAPALGTSASTIPTFVTNFPVDLGFYHSRANTADWFLSSRLQGGGTLNTNTTFAEAVPDANYAFDSNTGWGKNFNSDKASSNFRRAPSFFDEVCYTGTGSNQTLPHNLGAVPQLMITKNRSNASNWRVYDAFNGPTKRGSLNDSQAWDVQSTMWNDTAPTSTVFTVGTSNSASSQTYVIYLFTTCAGVSKVGSYTGTGTTQTINCGFTGGARFVLIKRTDSTGDWYVWDSARGIVAGNDPYLRLNLEAAEVTSTDYIDTTSVGFEITSTAPAEINANGGTFIFLAIA